MNFDAIAPENYHNQSLGDYYDNRESILASIEKFPKHGPTILQYTDPHLLKDFSFMMAAVAINPHALKYVHDDIKKHASLFKILVLTAVRKDGDALMHVKELDDTLYKNRSDILSLAIRTNPSSIHHIARLVLDHIARSHVYVSNDEFDKIFHDEFKPLLLQAMSQDETVLKSNQHKEYVKKYLHDKEFMLEAIEHNHNVYFEYKRVLSKLDNEFDLQAILRNEAIINEMPRKYTALPFEQILMAVTEERMKPDAANSILIILLKYKKMQKSKGYETKETDRYIQLINSMDQLNYNHMELMKYLEEEEQILDNSFEDEP